MTPHMDAYEKLVEQEDQLVKRVWICEETSNTIFYLLFQRGDAISLSTCRNILTEIQQIRERLQNDLLNLRLEKSMLSYRHAKQQRGREPVEE
ncbi:hypothetical protein [Saccharibacillus brassicae]|uniref:Uncharacterized protein n=1 Tax=Saccharibacillus brassicae TaxID=2583377 RepID=A0A4Y6UU57_SACBS|nr:hypothetical protein [Saccharibacillus brassicae]QDH21223.1 hypothetical protein FFV09_10385 [Saccharibacillus brassicae]